MSIMAGIDKIIQQIEDDTRAICDGIIASAQQKADKITSEAAQKAEGIKARSHDAAAEKAADIKKRGESAADLEEKRILLTAKQEIISQMLQAAIKRVKELPDNEYFALILKMIGKYSQPKDGVIRFGKKDMERLPAGFIDEINKVSNGKLVLSDECAAIDSGFILIYGGIEENCSFDSIFMSEDEAIKDRAGKLLFGKG